MKKGDLVEKKERPEKRAKTTVVFLGIQLPSENDDGTKIACVSEVIGHPNHQLRIWLDAFGLGYSI